MTVRGRRVSPNLRVLLKRMRTVIRRGAALTLVGGMTVVVVLSYLPASTLAPCREQLGSGGSPIGICRPIGTDDIVVVGLVLLCAAAFLWPDLSEFAIPGLVSLKKEVSATKDAVADTERRTAEITADVQNINLAMPKPDVARAARELQLPDATMIDAQEREVSAGTRERPGHQQREEGRLLLLINEMDVYVGAATAAEAGKFLSEAMDRGLVRFGDLGMQVAALRRWRVRFDDQLSAWGAVRNIALHTPDRLSDAEVDQAIALGERLAAAARESLDAIT